MLIDGTLINKPGVDRVETAGCVCFREGLTTQAVSGHRCVVSSDVLQHHDASAVIPLNADPTRCIDQVHAACVFNIKRVTGKRQFGRPVVYSHLVIEKGAYKISIIYRVNIVT